MAKRFIVLTGATDHEKILDERKRELERLHFKSWHSILLAITSKIRRTMREVYHSNSRVTSHVGISFKKSIIGGKGRVDSLVSEYVWTGERTYRHVMDYLKYKVGEFRIVRVSFVQKKLLVALRENSCHNFWHKLSVFSVILWLFSNNISQLKFDGYEYW